jgi:hypothetical protein
MIRDCSEPSVATSVKSVLCTLKVPLATQFAAHRYFEQFKSSQWFVTAKSTVSIALDQASISIGFEDNTTEEVSSLHFDRH